MIFFVLIIIGAIVGICIMSAKMGKKPKGDNAGKLKVSENLAEKDSKMSSPAPSVTPSPVKESPAPSHQPVADPNQVIARFVEYHDNGSWWKCKACESENQDSSFMCVVCGHVKKV